jgi:hypothetical protein
MMDITIDSLYYFHAVSGLLIRIETTFHGIEYQNNSQWLHYEIEKNLVQYNDQLIGYVYDPEQPEEPNPGLWWALGTGAVVLVGVFVNFVILKRPIKKDP